MALKKQERAQVKVYLDTKKGRRAVNNSAAPENSGVTKKQASGNIKRLDKAGYRVPEALKHN